MFKLSQIRPADFQNAVKVQFIGEPAVDQGGPSLEFFSILNTTAKRKIILNGVFRHHVSLLQQKQYFFIWPAYSIRPSARVTSS